MTNQEKIAQLALAALRSGPPPTTPPKPATFGPVHRYEPVQPGVVQVAAVAPVAEVVVAVANAPVAEAASPVIAPAFKDEGDPELRAAIEERDTVMAKKRSRQKWVLNLTALAAVASVCVWVANTPSALAKVKSLGPAMKQSVNDAKTLGTITQQYDKQLDKVAVRSTQLDEASRAMGVDPATVSKKENPQMEAEMKQMTGGEQTTADSARALKEKFGFVEKMAGRDKKEPEAGPQ